MVCVVYCDCLTLFNVKQPVVNVLGRVIIL
jgi:hypothetical protein